MLNSEQFKTIFVIVVVLSVITVCLLLIYFKKKGVNIEDSRFQLKIGLSFLTIIIAVFWFIENLSLLNKISITAGAFIVGLGTYFFVDRVGRKLRKSLNIETRANKNRKQKDEETKKKSGNSRE